MAHGTIDCTVGPRSGPDCTIGPQSGPIAPSGPDRAPIAPSGPDRAPIAPSGPDQGKIALSLVALLYKAASSATPAVSTVRGVPRGFWEGVVLLGISPELIVFSSYVYFATDFQMRFQKRSTPCFDGFEENNKRHHHTHQGFLDG